MRLPLRWLAALTAAGLSTTAFAQARINTVSYDLVSGALVLTGTDLKGSATTVVTLGGTGLTVLANTATSLTAQMPPNQGVGEFLIFLKRTQAPLEAASVGEASYSLSIIEPVPGPQGDVGPQGPAGVSGYTVMTAVSPNDSQETRIVSATCPAGKVVLGGGQLVLPFTAAVYRAIAVPTSRPNATNNGWTAGAVEIPTNYTSNWQLTVYAICAAVGS